VKQADIVINAAALKQVPTVALSGDGAKVVQEAGFPIRVDRPDAFSNLPAESQAAAVLDDPKVREALLGTDEAAAADLLIEQGVKMVLLHQNVGPSVDDDRRVLSRLYHHAQLDRFRLVRVGPGTLYYELRGTPVAFPPQVAGLCIQYLRARLEGKRVEGFPKIDSDTGEWTFVVTLRAQGGELVTAFARNKRLDHALDELVDDLEAQHRRHVEPTGRARISQDIDQLSIEIERLTERAYVEPRDDTTLTDLIELGVDGAYMMTPDKKQRGFLPGAMSYTRSLITADDFLQDAAAEGHMSDRRPWRDPAAWLEIFRGIRYREEPGKGLVYLYRGVPPVPLASVTLDSTRQAILSAGDWWLANMALDGFLDYKFWPSEVRFSGDYNHVRHTLATWSLVQAWRVDPDHNPAYLDGARRALDWTNRYLVDEGDMSYFSFNGNQKLGSVVVNLMGLIDLARATGSHEWDDSIRRQARFILFMQEPSGTFRGYYVPRGHPYYNQVNDIVPGEAALALVMVAEYLDEDQWITTLPRFFQYYEPWFHSRAAKRHDDRPWPAYTYDNDVRLDLVQFGPWTVMAADAYQRRTGDDEVGAFGLEVGRWMIDTYMYDNEHTPYPDYMGGYYKLPGELPAMQAFCYAEGTAAAYSLALRMGREDDARYFDARTRETIRFAMVMQYDDLDTYAFSRPELLWGGVRYAMNETKVRIDYTYHGQSSMVQWYEAALTDPKLPAEVREGPPARPRPRALLAAEGKTAPPGFESMHNIREPAPPAKAAATEPGASSGKGAPSPSASAAPAVTVPSQPDEAGEEE